MIPITPRTLALLSLVVCAPAAAQERFTALPVGGTFDPPIVVDVELDAGGVTDLVETNLQGVAPVQLGSPFGVERVGSRLWLATDDGIYRFDEVGGGVAVRIAVEGCSC